MNPLLCWTGGKTRLKKRIVARMPEHKTYVEPFIGGGSVFLAKGRSQKEIINDLNPDLVDFYKSVQKNPEILKDCKVPMKCHDDFKKLQMSRPRSAKGRACKFTNLNKASYACNHRRFSPGNVDNFEQRVDNVGKRNPQVTQRLQGVKIENKDFRQVIKENDGKDTLVFLDPPYASTHLEYGHGDDLSAQEVFDTVKGIKGKFMLTYKDSPEFRKLFCSEFKCEIVDTVYGRQVASTHKPKPVTELLITNF